MGEWPLLIATLLLVLGMLLSLWVGTRQQREARARRKAREGREVEMVRENRPRGTYIHCTKDKDDE